jgi:hypothetical protein
MSGERNQVMIFHDLIHLLAEIQAHSSSNSTALYNGLKSWGAGGNQAMADVVQKKLWYFMIRRESIFLKRGKGGGASDSSRISSLGILGLRPKLETKFEPIRRLYGGKDLRDLWRSHAHWGKMEMQVLSFIYEDSRLSTIIAKRAINQNQFIDDKLSENAKMRHDIKAPANPEMITGSWQDFDQIDYADSVETAFNSYAREMSSSLPLPKAPQIHF